MNTACNQDMGCRALASLGIAVFLALVYAIAWYVEKQSDDDGDEQ